MTFRELNEAGDRAWSKISDGFLDCDIVTFGIVAIFLIFAVCFTSSLEEKKNDEMY